MSEGGVLMHPYSQMYVYMFLVAFKDFRDRKQRGEFEKMGSAGERDLPMYQTQQQRDMSQESIVKPAYAHQERGRTESGESGYGRTASRY